MTDENAIKVTYPGATGSDKDNNKPVVYIFGWAGASDEKLAEISKIYEENGHITVRYTAPKFHIFISQEKIPGKSKMLLDFIQKQPFKNNPMVFHVFSNLGCAVYQHFSEEILTNSENESMRDNFKGMIFDSCPGERVLPSFFNALAFVMGGNFLRRRVFPFLLFLFFGFKIPFLIIRSKLTGAKMEFWDMYLKRDPVKMPRLYLYSKSDDCVFAEGTENFANIMEKAGNPVEKVDFQDSEHVSHFWKYPDLYKKTVTEFVDKL